MGLAKDNDAVRELNGYLTTFRDEPDRWKYIYTFDVFQQKWYYIDGQERQPYQNRKD